MPRWRLQAVTSWWPIAMSGRAAHLVHHEARVEGRDLVLERRRLSGRLLLDDRQQVGRRADAVGVLGVERRVHDLAHALGRGHRAQAPVERALDEAVAVLDRGGLGHDRQHPDVRDQEEVEDVEGGPGAQVDQHDVDVERADAVQQAHLLLVLDVRGRQHVGRAADEAQARTARLLRDLLDRLDAADG
jgi:hypothetical protein